MIPTFKALRNFLSIKRLQRIFLALMVGGTLYFCSFIAVAHIIGATDRTEAADVIIVLGAGIRRDGRAGWALTRRAEMGAELWQKGLARYVLCTGAQAAGYPRSEAEACRELLVKNNVPESAILMEENSRSTEENAIYSQKIINEYALTSAILVTDSYHTLRSEWIFRDTGIVAYTSPIPASQINRPAFYPYSLVREFVAFHWYVVKDIFNIPITHIYGL